MISMDKKYTVGARPFTVLTITKPGPLPVAGYDDLGNVHSFTSQGHYGPSSLVEVSPYADFVIDEKVMVRNYASLDWDRKFFRGINARDGKAMASYLPIWTGPHATPASWLQCRRPTDEELAT